MKELLQAPLEGAWKPFELKLTLGGQDAGTLKGEIMFEWAAKGK
jgi:hypothetical protein